MTAETLHQKYINETYDENGKLIDYKLICPDKFNFAYDVIDKIAEIDPNRHAMLWCNPKGEEHIFTYGELKKNSDKVANMLRAKGIGKGDKVMLILKRHYQFWFTIIALHKLGAIAIPATFLLTKHDIEYRSNAAGVKMIICTADGDVADHVDTAMPECSTVKSRIIVNGTRDNWESFSKLFDEATEDFEPIEYTSQDPMLMYFSSGTTGHPKMVLHKNSYPIGHLVTAKLWQNVEPNGLHLTISDTGWAKAAWGKIYGQLMLGTCLFIYDFDKFEATDILEKVSTNRVTTLCCPPTMFRFFLLEDVKKFDLSALKYCNIAGEALSPDVFNKWYEATGIKLMEGFGQSETTVLIANLIGMTPKPGSMGKPVPHYDVHIVDEDGKSVPTGTTGEIVIRTEPEAPIGLFTGYYNDELKTNESWHDGFYHTGDTAWEDEDGYLWYVGRTDDVIKSSGYRIGPFEIESVLAEHDAVLECAVTGIPDPIRGNIVKATIVLKRGYEPSNELIKELQNHVKVQTAPYKYPRVIDFVEELPKTTSGKIRRIAIREADFEKNSK
ncbi:MAG: AMP-binding protein [Oscillospiraceae bacterium]